MFSSLQHGYVRNIFISTSFVSAMFVGKAETFVKGDHISNNCHCMHSINQKKAQLELFFISREVSCHHDVEYLKVL